MTTRDELPIPGVGRALFLKVRCAYIRQLLAAENCSEAEAADAVNVHDEMQVRLIGMTPPGFGDGTVTASIIELVRSLPAATRAVVLDALDACPKYQRQVFEDKLNEYIEKTKDAESRVAELEREVARLNALVENWKPVMLSALRNACHVDALAEVTDELPYEFDPRNDRVIAARPDDGGEGGK